MVTKEDVRFLTQETRQVIETLKAAPAIPDATYDHLEALARKLDEIVAKIERPAETVPAQQFAKPPKKRTKKQDTEPPVEKEATEETEGDK